MRQGYIHIYTGNGKGKTTAAFGLALRAICAGCNVYIGQFVKSMCYSETRLVDLMQMLFLALCVLNNWEMAVVSMELLRRKIF